MKQRLTYWLIDAGCKYTLSLIKDGIPAEDIYVYEPDDKYYRFASTLQRIYGFNLTQTEFEMKKFSVTVSNPPFSVGSHGTGKNDYVKFVRKQYELTEEGGKMIAIHPYAMRREQNRDFYRDNNVTHLSIHSSNEKIFGKDVNTPVEWYVLEKKERDSDMQVRFSGEDEWVTFDMSKYPFIPNHSLDLLNKFISADSNIPRLNFIKGNARRHKSRLKKGENFDPTQPFSGAHVNIFKTTDKGVTYCYDIIPSPYKNELKVIIGEGGKYPVYDDGKHGVSDQCFWMVVDSKEEADAIIEYLQNDEFARYCHACCLGAQFRVSPDMLNVIPNPHYV